MSKELRTLDRDKDPEGGGASPHVVSPPCDPHGNKDSSPATPPGSEPSAVALVARIPELLQMIAQRLVRLEIQVAQLEVGLRAGLHRSNITQDQLDISPAASTQPDPELNPEQDKPRWEGSD